MAAKNTARTRDKSRSARPATGEQLFAAVDLGTNNCRLLVARRHGSSFRVVDSHSQIATLGEGLHATGELSEAAIGRAIEALRAIRRKIEENNVSKVRCIATEACRRARNGAAFVQQIQQETGLRFKIIDAAEEARLATVGCYDLIDSKARRVLVIDIGGGSTELSWVNAEQARERGLVGQVQRAPIIDWTSLPLGVVTLFDAFSHLPEADAYAAMKAHACETIRSWHRLPDVSRGLSHQSSHFIGTSGTVTCLAGVHLGLDRYRRDKVDGCWMDRTDATSVIAKVSALDSDGRAQLPTIGTDRARLMHAGCAILDALWETIPAHRMRVGDRGLREGLLLTMMHARRPSRRRRTNRNAGKSVAADKPFLEGAAE